MSGGAVRLPAGRHGLPRELVVENQRVRLRLAAAEVLAECGYARVTVGAILKRARISKRTYYQQFADLWECLADAYKVASDQLCEEISGACSGADGEDGAGGDDWPDRLSAGVEAALAWAAANPDFARLLSAAPPPTVESLRSARRELTERLASLLRAGGEQQGLEERLVDASLSLVAARLTSGGADALPKLAPELTEILARPHPYRGSRAPLRPRPRPE